MDIRKVTSYSWYFVDPSFDDTPYPPYLLTEGLSRGLSR